MTGRITDAYTNIATVKLFSHARREASYARGAMQEFLDTVHRQMRLVTVFEIANHILSISLSRQHRASRSAFGPRETSGSAPWPRRPRWPSASTASRTG